MNKYSGEFGITTPARMAHFIGQIGAESKGLTSLRESSLYSPRAVAQIFPYPKYGHLFEEAFLNTTTYQYSYTPINFDENSCSGTEIARGNATFSYTTVATIRNAYAAVKNDTIEVTLNGKKTKVPTYKTRTDVTKDNIEAKVSDGSYNSGQLRVKSEYIRSSALFDVTYACRMGNGSVASKDGSTFLGKGFIHITGKAGYKKISEEWNKLYPDDPKEFHGKDINLLETDVEVAMKASMVYWQTHKYDSKSANDYADKNDIESLTKLVNGGDNGIGDREKYTNNLMKEFK